MGKSKELLTEEQLREHEETIKLVRSQELLTEAQLSKVFDALIAVNNHRICTANDWRKPYPQDFLDHLDSQLEDERK